jgi:dihydroneopterin aldolase
MSALRRDPTFHLSAAQVFVRGLRVDARIGVHDHERELEQPLVIDVSLETTVVGATELAQTVNYEMVVQAARGLAAQGHVLLVETFAERLARRLLDGDRRIVGVTVRIEKPLALAPAAEAAGVELRLTRQARP